MSIPIISEHPRHPGSVTRHFRLLLIALFAGLICAHASAADASRRIRVAGVQMPVTKDVDANLAVLERAVQYAAAQKADVLLTPEGSLSGYNGKFDAARTAAALDRITAAAQKANVALALGTCFQEPDDGKKYDELRFYDSKGAYLGFHAKILLCRKLDNPAAKGEMAVVSTRPLRTFDLDQTTVGGLVCNDFWANPGYTPQPDPHLTRELAGKGARVIFQAVNSGLAEGEELQLNRHYHEANLCLRARSDKLWIVVADAADPEGKRANNCPSGVVSPEGKWAIRIDTPGEHFFTYDIELK